MLLFNSSKLTLSLLVLSFLAFTTGTTVHAASFQGLGDLPGGDFYSHALDVSADGSTVVGSSQSASGGEAYRWTSASGMVGLGWLSSVRPSGASGVSADGSVVVGGSNSTSGNVGFRWTSASGMVSLGAIPAINNFSGATGVSADGSVVVGVVNTNSGEESFRWTSASGMVRIVGDDSGADGVSADGSTVVGWYNWEAYRWTSASGMVGLGWLPGGSLDSFAEGVSADGSVIVGMGSSSSGDEAFRWTSGGGMVGLGDLTGGRFNSSAEDVSADGSVVVGRGSQGAFLWDTTNGMRSLQAVLTTDFGLDLTGWNLQLASGISDDGLTIVGYGRNPSDNYEAWIATIPEPTTICLLGLGSLGLLRKRKSA